MHVLASEQESHRALLTPDEVLRPPPDAALVFVSGSRPIFGRKLHYFRDPSFAARARIPPPEISDRLPHQGCSWPTSADLASPALPPAHPNPEAPEGSPAGTPSDAPLPEAEALLADGPQAAEQ